MDYGRSVVFEGRLAREWMIGEAAPVAAQQGQTALSREEMGPERGLMQPLSTSHPNGAIEFCSSFKLQ